MTERSPTDPGQASIHDGADSVRVIASKRNWIVSEAVTQLEGVARLPGVVQAVGMPDLHPGKGVPIGAVMVTEDVIYPHLAGNDIGCGMGLWQTDLRAKNPKLDRWTKKLKGLEGPWDGDVGAWLDERELAPTPFDRSLGTIGGGNHFAELQTFETVDEESMFDTLGLCADRLVLMVHSGSRGFGESLLQDHVKQFGTSGLSCASEEALAYLARHDHAVVWAKANRSLIAERFLSLLGAAGERAVDLCHNSVTAKNLNDRPSWLHRKGAAPSDAGPVLIPGSRGALSYLVEPVGDQALGVHSVAHGAGRKWSRSDARSRLERRYAPESLKRTKLGSRVICDDKNLLYEEAPQAYKDIDIVIQDLVQAGLVRVVATLRPLITYKTMVTSR